MEQLTEKELDKFQRLIDSRNELVETIRKNTDEIVQTIMEHGI